jgi:hypothetical protein
MGFSCFLQFLMLILTEVKRISCNPRMRLAICPPPLPFEQKRIVSSHGMRPLSIPWLAYERPHNLHLRIHPLAQRDLENNAESEFDLAGGAERVNACSDSHSIHIVCGMSGSVDLPRRPCQESVEGISR